MTPGDQTRDFIYVDDVVDAILRIIENSHKFDVGYFDFEIGTGIATPLRDFIKTAHTLCGSKTELLFGALPYREGEIMHSVANLNNLFNLGWRPKYSYYEGLVKTISSEF